MYKSKNESFVVFKKWTGLILIFFLGQIRAQTNTSIYVLDTMNIHTFHGKLTISFLKTVSPTRYWGNVNLKVARDERSQDLKNQHGTHINININIINI